MTSYAINMQGVTRRFGDTCAVDDLSLSVAVGEVFGFLGHNGAGKTTSVRLLNGVLMADSGDIRVLGLDPQTEGPQLRSRTGVLTETPSLDERHRRSVTPAHPRSPDTETSRASGQDRSLRPPPAHVAQ